jgi:ABC-2 type transport system permease protein
MGSIKLIALKEFKESLKDKSFIILSAIMLILMLSALLLGMLQYNELKIMKEKASREVRNQWLNQGEKNPHGAGHFGSITFKPINPLFIFDKGVYNYLGTYVMMETHMQHEAENRPANDQTSLLRFGGLSLGFLMQYLLPLFVILISYQSFSGEKERNTLKLLLSQHLTRTKLLIGKLCGILLKLTIVFVPLIIGTIIFTAFTNELTATLLLSLTYIFIFYIAYTLIFVFISLGISAWTSSSSNTLLILLCLWIVTSVLIPRVFTSLSEKVYPTPSNIESRIFYDNEQGNKWVYSYKAFDNFNKIYNDTEKKLMKEHNVTVKDSLKINVFGLAIEETEEEGQRVYDKTYGKINKAFTDQNTIQRYTSILSPVAGMRFLSMGLCGNGIEEHINYTTTSELYRRNMMKTMNLDIAYNSGNNEYDVNKRLAKKEYKRGRELWEKVPDFSYSFLSVNQVLKNHYTDILSLSAWLMVSVCFSFVSIKRLL